MESPKETPNSIANFFISKGLSENKELTPMKLVKLAYISHGWHLAINEKPLFDEDVQAWKYGPVIQSLYYSTKNMDKIKSLLIESSSRSSSINIPKISEENQSLIKLLAKIWDVYKDLDGPKLSTLTHKEGTPWYIVWHEMGGKDKYGAIIPNELIKEHYKLKATLSKKGN